MSEQLVEVLAIDGDLADGLDGARLQAARRNCVSPVLTVASGEWQPDGLESPDPGGFGLLLLSGFLVRRVGQGGRYGAELLGPGDLLRPWQTVGQVASIPFEPRWEAIADTRLAVLGSSFARRASPYPSVACQIAGRAMLRSRHLAVNLAIVQQARIDTRLRMLFWHLADRFGQVRGDWIHVDVPLTHNLLSELVAARRPSVTTALSNLKELGILRRDGEEWLLRGPAPAELDQLRDAG